MKEYENWVIKKYNKYLRKIYHGFSNKGIRLKCRWTYDIKSAKKFNWFEAWNISQAVNCQRIKIDEEAQ
jgi:hypothetical protein